MDKAIERLLKILEQQNEEARSELERDRLRRFYQNTPIQEEIERKHR